MSAMSIIINNSVFSLRTGTNVYCVKDTVLLHIHTFKLKMLRFLFLFSIFRDRVLKGLFYCVKTKWHESNSSNSIANDCFPCTSDTIFVTRRWRRVSIERTFVRVCVHVSVCPCIRPSVPNPVSAVPPGRRLIWFAWDFKRFLAQI